MATTDLGLKYNIKFYLESRKDNKTGELISENIPILMSVTFDGKRLFYFIGHRTDIDKWIDRTKEGETLPYMKKNTFNHAKESAAIVNAKIRQYHSTVEDLFREAGKTYPSVIGLRGLIKEKLSGHSNGQVGIDLSSYFEQYITEKDVSHWRKKQLKSTKNHFERFLCESRLKISLDDITPVTLQKFEKWLKSDPKKPRSKNTIIGIMNRLKAFYKYANAPKQKWTTNDPFLDYSIESEVYGDPIFLTKEERDHLYEAEIKNERLARIRDMFVLQCFIGCRIGDFVQMKRSNIVDGFLHYVPSKTANGNQKTCRVPLSQKALAIIGRYEMPDDSLFPFISGQKYNDYLKELFREVELYRTVVRMNPLTRQNEVVTLDKVVSSHMARRTFIGLLHKKVKNEIIASMSGHVENSRAFKRYYNVDEDDQMNAIKLIE